MNSGVIFMIILYRYREKYTKKCKNYYTAIFVITDEPVRDNPLIHVDSDNDVTLGKPCDFPSYGWDNEYGEWKVK